MHSILISSFVCVCVCLHIQGDPKTVLPDDKPKTIQFTKDSASDSYIRVPESVKVAGPIKSSITLPPSLATQLLSVNNGTSHNGTSNVGVIFSMYETGVMFPIAEGNGARRNETNVSSVISATVLGQAVQDLKDNITYTINFGENVSPLEHNNIIIVASYRECGFTILL